ncbi:peptidyl-prolyl cis-trans isomerase cyp8 [Plectosphaerella plurivora]|uniref:Peptidyl-prolyl cis-trans isomerase-like 2 n=1 Tax=Plectosphaerella plurivora TaxID=936078 RepID=A0A9P8V129_9PEZI|nr:peptidyl-prolyl cis-trans isomerase cyp8 [Plectosphaerella plurivora]
MGKGTDKLYITHSEWSSGDNYSASAGARGRAGAHSFRRLPYNFCAASLQPFKNPVCTQDGTIFDLEVISAWLEKHKTNPVDGEPLAAKDLIKLNFARNASSDSQTPGFSDGQGDLIDPVSYKVFTDNTHIVAVRHGSYANVFSWETVERMNIKAKNWQDLVDDTEFTRADIITLQDPQNIASRDLGRFKHLTDGQTTILTPEQIEERKQGDINIDALGRVGEKVLRAKQAVEKARREREARGDVNRTGAGSVQKSALAAPKRTAMIQDKTIAPNAATYTTGRAAASFTSTGLTPETSGERALLTDEEYMLKPKRVKNKGYARIETTMGDLNIELFPEFAPRAVWNFTRLAQKGYYKGVTFHRNIRNFMIQGGDPTGTGKGGESIWGKTFVDEFEGPLTHNSRGILSMANKGKNTNSSQFFISYRAASHLDRKHTIFGKVAGGLDVLAKLENAPVDGSNRPLQPITMTDVVVYIDPFEEFMKGRAQQELATQKAEATRLGGGTEDDRMTWTGKRIRQDGNIETTAPMSKVGKYMEAAKADEAGDEIIEDLPDTWQEPSKKKTKMGGFGNFDGWA